MIQIWLLVFTSACSVMLFGTVAMGGSQEQIASTSPLPGGVASSGPISLYSLIGSPVSLPGSSGSGISVIPSWFPCVDGCSGDLNLDGIVDAGDLGLLIGAWDTDGSIVDGSDLNDDGIVNAADLGLLIGAWGVCQ